MAPSKKRETIFKPRDIYHAHKRLEGMAQQMWSAYNPEPVSIDDMVSDLFPEDIIRVCKEAREVVASTSQTCTYAASYVDPSVPAYVMITFPDAIAAPNAHYVQELPPGHRLRVHIEEAIQIAVGFDKAAYLLDWFNQHASLGAMRYYWPAFPMIFPGLEAPRSGREVEGISKLLPIIRETSALVAAATLIDKKEHIPYGPITIAFVARAQVDIGIGFEIERRSRRFSIPELPGGPCRFSSSTPKPIMMTSIPSVK